MYRTRAKNVYTQFQYIASYRHKTVYKQILSHFRCTMQEKLRHKHETHSGVCISVTQNSLLKMFENWWVKTWNSDQDYHWLFKVLQWFYHIYVSLSTNSLNFWVNPFVPYFIHTLECVSCLCLNFSCIMHLKWERICL